MRKIKEIVSAICLFFLFFNPALAQSTAAILPPGKTQFLDNNGNPLSSGKVYFYIPNTTTFKTTWQDAAETIPNTNPVTLDAGGRAIIYGSGVYRQRVFTSSNTLIYDVVTSSTGGGGGIGANGDGAAVGSVKPWAGLTLPSNYMYSYGQELSRTTYSDLFTATTLNQTLSCSSGSPILTGLSDTSQLPVGSVIEATCMPAGTTLIDKTSTTVTMNNNANLTTNTTGIFFLYGNGNGSTTFNVPDLRGYVIAGRCNMGGIACTNLTVAGMGSSGPNATGAKGGNQTKTLLPTNLPAYTPTGNIGAITPTGTVSAPTITINNGNNVTTGSVFGAGAGTTGGANVNITATSSVPIFSGNAVTPVFTGTAQGGASTPFSTVQSTQTLNYIIKVLPDANIIDNSGLWASDGVNINNTNTGNVGIGTTAATAKLTIIPTANTLNQGMSISQSSPIGGSTVGPQIYNNINVNTQSNIINGVAPCFPLDPVDPLCDNQARGFEVKMTTGSLNVGGYQIAQSIQLLHTIGTSDVHGGDFIGLATMAYSNKDGTNGGDPTVAGGLYSANFNAFIASGGRHTNLVAVNPEMGISAGGQADFRHGVRIQSTNNEVWGSTADSAIAIWSGGPNVANAPFKDFVTFSDYAATNAQSLGITGSMFRTAQTMTIFSVFNTPNLIVTNKILDFQHVSLTGSGTMTLNGQDPTSPYLSPLSNAVLKLTTSGGNEPILEMDSYGNTSSIALRATGGTQASPTALAADFTMGAIGAWGYGSTSYSSTAKSAILFKTSQIWTDVNQGSYINFETTANNSTSRIARMRIEDNGTLTINQNATFANPINPPAIANTGLHLIGGPAAETNINLDSFATDSAIFLRRADGTLAAPSAIQTDETIGVIAALGYGASAYSSTSRAALLMSASQNWTNANQGAYIDLQTTPNNTITRTTRARIENDGGITVPNTVTGGSKGAGTINATGLYINGVAISSSLTVGTTPITSGTTTRVLFDNAGVLGEYAISGTSSVCMTSACLMTGANIQLVGTFGIANNGFNTFFTTGSTNTANRIITINPNDAARSVLLSGDLTVSSSTSIGLGQYQGINSNTAATAGNIGEYVECSVASASALSLTSTTALDLCSISLTAGEWDLNALFEYQTGTATNIVTILGSYSLTANTLDVTPGRLSTVTYGSAGLAETNALDISVIGFTYRFSINATTTLHFVGRGTFSVSTLKLWGLGRATRVH